MFLKNKWSKKSFISKIPKGQLFLLKVTGGLVPKHLVATLNERVIIKENK